MGSQSGSGECLTYTRSQFSGHILVLYVPGTSMCLYINVQVIIYCPCPQGTYNFLLPPYNFFQRQKPDDIRTQLHSKYLLDICLVPNSTLTIFRNFIRSYPSLPETWTWDKKGSENNMGVNVFECSSHQVSKGQFAWRFCPQGRQCHTLWRKKQISLIFPSSICSSVAVTLVAFFVIGNWLVVGSEYFLFIC